MSIETASYISQLVLTNPVGGVDNYSTADDHLRLIKTVLQTQFPNLGPAAITLTAAQINAALMTQGVFTAAFGGFSIGVTGDVSYTIVGRMCTLRLISDVFNVSNAATLTMGSVPAICQPATSHRIPCGSLIDSVGIELHGMFSVGPSSTFAFFLSKTNAPATYVQTGNIGNFTPSGFKGIYSTWTVSYPLD